MAHCVTCDPLSINTHSSHTHIHTRPHTYLHFRASHASWRRWHKSPGTDTYTYTYTGLGGKKRIRLWLPHVIAFFQSSQGVPRVCAEFKVKRNKKKFIALLQLLQTKAITDLWSLTLPEADCFTPRLLVRRLNNAPLLLLIPSGGHDGVPVSSSGPGAWKKFHFYCARHLTLLIFQPTNDESMPRGDMSGIGGRGRGKGKRDGEATLGSCFSNPLPQVP